MIKIALLLLIAGLTAISFGGPLSDQRKCVFSIEIVADATNGAFIPGETHIGDSISIYQYDSGLITAERHLAWHRPGSQEPTENELWAGGKEFATRIRAAFNRAHLSDLDFEQDLLRAKGLSKEWHGFLGFPTVKVHADFEGTQFTIQHEGLGTILDVYAPLDPELQRLKGLLDAIAYEYGRRRIFLQ
jgi:hypothetical protein